MDMHTFFVLLVLFVVVVVGWFLGIVLLTPKTLGTAAFLILGKPGLSSVQ